MDTSKVVRLRTVSATRTFHSIGHIIILLLVAVSSVTAVDLDEYNSALFKRLAELGEIHIDVRPAPILRPFGIVERNAEVESSSSAPISSPTKTTGSSATVTSPAVIASTTGNSTMSAPSNSTISSATSTQTIPSTLPTPFDTSLGNNFTAASCPAFFNKFLSNATFVKCLPVSLLMQNSMQFHRALTSRPYLNKILDAACDAPSSVCSPVMASLARELVDDANCGADFGRQNMVVMQAYTGLTAYEPLHNATCLSNKSTGNYCFVDAVVNATNPSDLYPYFIALGIGLPSSGTPPSCSTCLQKTMDVFAIYAGQSDQPASDVYVASAQQINSNCGSSFATTNVKVAPKSASKNSAPRSQSPTIMIGAVAVSLSLLVLIG